MVFISQLSQDVKIGKEYCAAETFRGQMVISLCLTQKFHVSLCFTRRHVQTSSQHLFVIRQIGGSLNTGQWDPSGEALALVGPMRAEKVGM